MLDKVDLDLNRYLSEQERLELEAEHIELIINDILYGGGYYSPTGTFTSLEDVDLYNIAVTLADNPQEAKKLLINEVRELAINTAQKEADYADYN